MASPQMMWTSTCFIDLYVESFEVTLMKNVEEVDLHLFPVHVF